MVLKITVSKQEKLKNHPWVETQVNSALWYINVTLILLFSLSFISFQGFVRRPQKFDKMWEISFLLAFLENLNFNTGSHIEIKEHIFCDFSFTEYFWRVWSRRLWDITMERGKKLILLYWLISPYREWKMCLNV